MTVTLIAPTELDKAHVRSSTPANWVRRSAAGT